MTYNFENKFLSPFLNYFFWISLFVLMTISTISNYSIEITILKSIFSLLTTSILLVTIRRQNITVNRYLTRSEILLGLFILYLLISLSYSRNIDFGLIKLYNLLIVLYPIFFLRFYLDERLFGQSFINSLKIFVLAFTGLSIYIIITKPFIFSESGHFVNQFSHVFSGRFISLSIIIVSIFLTANLLSKAWYAIIIINSFALGVTSFRAGIISLIASTVIYLLLNLNERKKSHKILSLIAIHIFVLILSGLYQNIFIRLNWIGELINLGRVSDGTIAARIEAYKLAIVMWMESPIWGMGIGGFNSIFENNLIGTYLKYPHNIIFELLAETGLIGFILFSCFGLSSAKKIYYYSKEGFTVFLFVFILTLFSKDLASNAILLGLTLIFSCASRIFKNNVVK